MLAASVLAFVVLAFAATPARACPSCAAGQEARADIFGPAFYRNLAVAVLPFVIIGAVCAHLQNWGRPR